MNITQENPVEYTMAFIRHDEGRGQHWKPIRLIKSVLIGPETPRVTGFLANRCTRYIPMHRSDRQHAECSGCHVLWGLVGDQEYHLLWITLLCSFTCVYYMCTYIYIWCYLLYLYLLVLFLYLHWCTFGKNIIFYHKWFNKIGISGIRWYGTV